MKLRKKPSSILAKSVEILFTQIPLTMSTGSHRCIPAGNLTGLSGAMNAPDAAKTLSSSGTPRCTNTMTILL